MNIVLVPHATHHKIWEVTINGEYWKKIHQSIFGRKPTLPSATTTEELQHLFDELEYQRAKRYLFWRLSTQNYHSDQLSKILQARLVQCCTIARVLKKFQDAGYIDDQKWLETFVRSKRSKYGMHAITAKLQAKGISSAAYKTIMQQQSTSDDDIQAIHKLLQTRYRSKDCKQTTQRRQVIQALQRRGFQFEQINAALYQHTSLDLSEKITQELI